MRMIGYKTKDEILNRTRQNIVRSTPLISIDRASTLSGLADAFSSEVAELYDATEATYLARFARTAAGPLLDALLAERNLRRKIQFSTNVPCASRTLSIRTKDGSTLASNMADPTKSHHIVGTGAILRASSDPSLRMATTEPAIFGKSDTRVCFGATGEFINKQVISAGTFDEIDYADLPVFEGADMSAIEVVQSTNIIGVQQVESDEQARQRYFNWSTAAAGGNDIALVSGALSHPEIAQIYPLRYGNGTGSVEYIVVPSGKRLSKSALDSITASITKLKSAGERVTAVESNYVPVYMTIAVPSSSLSSQAIDVIENYVANIGLGGTIGHSTVRAALLSAGIEASVVSLTVDGKKLLPNSVFAILYNEVYDLEAPIGSPTQKSPVNVIIG